MNNVEIFSKTAIRHTLAALAYRSAKILTDAPLDFGLIRVDPKSRPAIYVLSHIGDLFDWALSMVKGENQWHDSSPKTWDEEVKRFYTALERLDEYIAADGEIKCPMERLFQGPIADAFTHVGQLAMLRRMAGKPVMGENYFVAEIAIGNVGIAQPKPVREFE